MIQNQRFHIQSLAQKKSSKKKSILKTANLHEQKPDQDSHKIDWRKTEDIFKNGVSNLIGDAVGDELGLVFSDLVGSGMCDAIGDIIGDKIEIDNANHTLILLPLMSILLIVRRFRGR